MQSHSPFIRQSKNHVRLKLIQVKQPYREIFLHQHDYPGCLLIKIKLRSMIVHILKFNAKAGKDKTVHKIIRKFLHMLREEEHKGMSYHSFRDSEDKRHFIHIEIFETEDA